MMPVLIQGHPLVVVELPEHWLASLVLGNPHNHCYIYMNASLIALLHATQVTGLCSVYAACVRHQYVGVALCSWRLSWLCAQSSGTGRSIDVNKMPRSSPLSFLMVWA